MENKLSTSSYLLNNTGVAVGGIMVGVMEFLFFSFSSGYMLIKAAIITPAKPTNAMSKLILSLTGRLAFCWIVLLRDIHFPSKATATIILASVSKSLLTVLGTLSEAARHQAMESAAWREKAFPPCLDNSDEHGVTHTSHSSTTTMADALPAVSHGAGITKYVSRMGQSFARQSSSRAGWRAQDCALIRVMLECAQVVRNNERMKR